MPAVQRNIGTKLFTETRVSVATTPDTRTCNSHLFDKIYYSKRLDQLKNTLTGAVLHIY